MIYGRIKSQTPSSSDSLVAIKPKSTALSYKRHVLLHLEYLLKIYCHESSQDPTSSGINVATAL